MIYEMYLLFQILSFAWFISKELGGAMYDVLQFLDYLINIFSSSSTF